MAEAPLVLVSPAMGIGSWFYAPLIAEFESRGWRAQALPRRGFESRTHVASRANDWSYLDEIDDITTAVAAARAEYPDTPILLLGHSLGGQQVVGHQVLAGGADAIVTVGGAIPEYRHFPRGGLPLAFMAGVLVPVLTTAVGYVPKPAFGGPGARTMMRQWARMVLTGVPPFGADRRVAVPSLVVSFANDNLAPTPAVDAFAESLFEPEALTRWHFLDQEVPEGASNDHIAWVKAPAPVVDRIEQWWSYAANSTTLKEMS